MVVFMYNLNPYMTNGLSHRYHFDESTLMFKGFGSNLSFLFHFSMKIMLANSIAPYGTPHFHIWGCSVCLCPKKRTLGLYGLNLHFNRMNSHSYRISYTSNLAIFLWLVYTNLIFKCILYIKLKYTNLPCYFVLLPKIPFLYSLVV